VIRILAERTLPLVLSTVVDDAFGVFEGALTHEKARDDLLEFLFDRMRGYLAEAGYSAAEIDAVLAVRPARIDLVPLQLDAVRVINTLPEAPALAAANKRIGNILKQAGAVRPAFDVALLVLPEEKTLAAAFKLLQVNVEQAYRDLEYTQALKALATLKAPVDAFFDKVMVMDKDSRVRENRIGFLGTLHGTMNRIADLSKLAT
jgi:glycyl-tRNA synthetase beta chain